MDEIRAYGSMALADDAPCSAATQHSRASAKFELNEPHYSAQNARFSLRSIPWFT
jgi:hypothetical protein